MGCAIQAISGKMRAVKPGKVDEGRVYGGSHAERGREYCGCARKGASRSRPSSDAHRFQAAMARAPATAAPVTSAMMSGLTPV